MLIGSIQFAFSQKAIGWEKYPYNGWLYHNKGVALGDSVYPYYKLLITNKAAGEENIFMQIANTILTGSLATDGFLVGLNGINAILNQQENADIIFKTNATDRAIIKNNGFVGIGILDPKHDLHVHGTGTTGGGTSGEFGVSTRPDFAKSSSTESNKGLGLGNFNLPTNQPSPYAAIQLTNNTTGTTVNDGLLFEIINNDAKINLQEQGSISFRNSGKTSMEITKENNIKIGSITSPNTNIKVDISTLHKNGLLVTTYNNPDGYIFKARSNYNSNALVVKGDGKVGIGTDNPVEAVQIGDRFVIHNGGTKVIGYNWHYENGSSKYITNGYSSQIRFGGNGTLSFVVSPSGSAGQNITDEKYAIHISNDGKVGIGTTNPHGYELAVKGFAIAEDFTVQEYTDWPDYVFNDNYNILSISELETFVKKNKHLPGIPTEVDVKENGVKLGEMNKKLLQKVEELTLYIIQQQKEIEALQKEVETLKKQ